MANYQQDDSSFLEKGENIQQDEFFNYNRVQQLEIIDKLRELGVGDDISLPQVSSVDGNHSFGH